MTIPVNAGAMHTTLVKNPGAAADSIRFANDKNATAQPGVEQFMKEQANKKAATPTHSKRQKV